MLKDNVLKDRNDDKGFDPASNASTTETYSEMLPTVELRFNAAAGIGYEIESSTDLENWEPVEEGGRAGEGIAGGLPEEAAPAAGEPGEECGGAALGAEVPGLQPHGAS